MKQLTDELYERMVSDLERLRTPPRGYPECTSAIVRAMAEPHGENLIRVMHANENLIGRLYRTLERLHSLHLNEAHTGPGQPQWDAAKLLAELQGTVVDGE